MSVRDLTALSDAGDIVLDHFGGQPFELVSVVAGDGVIMIGVAGTMLATEVISVNRASTDDDGDDIRLTTWGDQSADILVTTITASGGADG